MHVGPLGVIYLVDQAIEAICDLLRRPDMHFVQQVGLNTA